MTIEPNKMAVERAIKGMGGRIQEGRVVLDD
jgi:hypothetical protein